MGKERDGERRAMSAIDLGSRPADPCRADAAPPSPAGLRARIRPASPEMCEGALLLVSRDRFVTGGDQWYISQAVVRVDDQAELRRALEEGRLDDQAAESLVEIEEAVPLRRADRQVDRFLAELERILAGAAGRPVSVRVTEPRWAAALREYQDLFPRLHVLPGHDPLVACLSAACLRRHTRERRRVVGLVESRREWAAFSQQSGRGHVALPWQGDGAEGGCAPGEPEPPLQIASDGARNPRRGTSWGYFTSEGAFRLGVCVGDVVAAELHALRMALEDHPGTSVVLWSDSRRALGLVHAFLREGAESEDRAVARDVRRIVQIVQDRRGAGLETRLRWVQAHSARLASTSEVLNDAADRLAKLALRRWCTPGLADGIEDIALSIAHEAVRTLGDLEAARRADDEPDSASDGVSVPDRASVLEALDVPAVLRLAR